jgi:capsular exopolysaccharide synthesis family protein
MPRVNNRPTTLIVQGESDPILSEAYATLRLNMEFSEYGENIHTIMVASAGQGEGKTTTVTNLAINYAQAGKRTILIDADLRKPSLHLPFPGSNDLGLAQYLSQKGTSASNFIRETGIDNLSLIPAGSKIMNPSELLSSNRMDTLLEELKSRYDVVLVDTPPALGIIDAKIMATKCDAVLLVIEYGKVKRHVAKKLRDSFLQIKANIAGVVLNKSNREEVTTYPYG